jgi:hypothetical protein
MNTKWSYLHLFYEYNAILVRQTFIKRLMIYPKAVLSARGLPVAAWAGQIVERIYIKGLPESSGRAGSDHSSGAAAQAPPYRKSGLL